MSAFSGLNLVRLLARVGVGLGRLFWFLGKRGYALFLILLVLWLSWRALLYLVSSLMLPARPPPEIVDIATKLSESAVMRNLSARPGQAAIVHQRSPLSHYHRLDAGFQPDRFNGCTASQCHEPLPHGKNKADRAFLNMHATSIHCNVCHRPSEQQPLPLVWYDLRTGGGRAQAPALLQAYAWLTSPSTRNAAAFGPPDQAEIVRWLRAAAVEAGGESSLRSLAEHLAAVRAASDEFVRLVKVARDTVQGHFRGEYGAKVALANPANRKPLLGNPGTERAVRDYLSQRETLVAPNKQALLQQIHAPLREPTLHCAACHRTDQSLVDFPALGYPPARIETITSRQVTRAIDHIVEGRPFYLPEFLANPNAN